MWEPTSENQPVGTNQHGNQPVWVWEPTSMGTNQWEPTSIGNNQTIKRVVWGNINVIKKDKL